MPQGLTETAFGEEATLVVAEWRDPLRDAHGSEAAEALAHAPLPVLIVRGDVAKFDRLVIVAGPDVATPAGRLDMTSDGVAGRAARPRSPRRRGDDQPRTRCGTCSPS